MDEMAVESERLSQEVAEASEVRTPSDDGVQQDGNPRQPQIHGMNTETHNRTTQ